MKKEESGVIWNETTERPDYFGSHLIFCDPDRRLHRLVGICPSLSKELRDGSIIPQSAPTLSEFNPDSTHRGCDRRHPWLLIQEETSVFPAADSRSGDPDYACTDQSDGMG